MKKGLGKPIYVILATALMFFLSFSIEALTVAPVAGQSVSGEPSGKPKKARRKRRLRL